MRKNIVNILSLFIIYILYSHISGITLLGVPSEIYSNGTQYLIVAVVNNIVVIVTVVYIYLPVFYDLQLTSVYEVYVFFLLFYIWKYYEHIIHINILYLLSLWIFLKFNLNFSIWDYGLIPKSVDCLRSSSPWT